MKKLLSLLLLFVLSVCFTSCGIINQNDSDNFSKATNDMPVQTTAEPTTVSEQQNAEKIIDQIIDKMTVEQKVGQLFYVRCPDSGAVEAVSKYNLGGYILFGRDFDGKTRTEIVENINSYQENSEIPLLIGTDEEGGSVVRVSSNTNLRKTPFLSPYDTFSDGGWDAIDKDANEKAELLLSLGINVNMAPDCDVTSNPDSFMYYRSFSSDADKVCKYVERVVKISSEKKLGSVLKHFPGYGDNEDTHTGIAYDNRELSELESKDFKPFKAGIESGADCVLVSHNIVKCIDSEYPASLSEKVHKILRENLGFDGVIMTDDLSMEAITDFTGADAAAVCAVKGGNDILCCTDVDVQYPAVLEAVKNGDISENQLNESVRRILRWKQKLGLELI